MLSTIGLHLDHTERCEVRTRLAAWLARAHGSHLHGIVPTGVVPQAGPQREGPAGAEIVSAALHLRRRAETVAHVFRCRARSFGVGAFDAELVDGAPIAAAIDHGRACDLLVVGQADAQACVEEPARRLHEEVMFRAGCPVLVVPRTGPVRAAGTRVLVAWDGGREAAMAARGALPLLRRASQVTLLSLAADDGREGPGIGPETADWLLRHGIAARCMADTARGGLADALLAQADALGADLIVMGGYGHARARERILGGVTREMLARAPVPLLMMH